MLRLSVRLTFRLEKCQDKSKVCNEEAVEEIGEVAGVKGIVHPSL